MLCEDLKKPSSSASDLVWRRTFVVAVPAMSTPSNGTILPLLLVSLRVLSFNLSGPAETRTKGFSTSLLAMLLSARTLAA